MSNEKLDPILYQDKRILVAYKSPGMPSVDDLSKDPSLMTILSTSISSKLFPVQRLDRPASGVIIFAKDKWTSAFLSNKIVQREVKKTYLAIVKKNTSFEDGILEHWIIRNPVRKKAYIVPETTKKAKRAKLSFRKTAESDYYSLVEIELETGRFHQIRAQLAHMEMPIKGDVKYGARRANRDRSIHLCSWKFCLQCNECEINIQGPIPKDPLWNIFNEINPVLLNPYQNIRWNI